MTKGVVKSSSSKGSFGHRFYDAYLRSYKILLFIPFVILILALAQLGFQYATTGEMVNRGIALKGGTSVTLEQAVDTVAIEHALREAFPKAEINIRVLGGDSGAIIELDVVDDSIEKIIRDTTGIQTFTIESTGPTLGEQFFSQAKGALIFTFIAMIIVSAIAFRTFVPSLGIVLAAFSNMVITLAVFNLLGGKLTGAGIAAFLMVIGYSVDSDILLTTRLLRGGDAKFKERLLGAIKTSFFMTATTAVAVVVAYLLTNSDVIRQIMFILIIGLVCDVFITYCQNANILRQYLKAKGEKIE